MNELALLHLGFARLCATMYAEPQDFDEAHSIALEALVKASRSFDESTGTSFLTWARIRIRGAIHDEHRRRRGRKRDNERPRIELTPSIDGCEVEWEAEEEVDRNRRLALLAENILRLPRREQAFVVGRLEGRELTEIAARFGLSKSRGSRIHTEAIQKLRTRLNRRPS